MAKVCKYCKRFNANVIDYKTDKTIKHTFKWRCSFCNKLNKF